MIVRILGEGQFRVDDSATDELNALDAALAALLDRIRSLGSPLAEDALEPSDLILPYADAGLEDVREMLTDEGLIPG